jgi:hypothetical protein
MTVGSGMLFLAGSNNDINVLNQSSLFIDIIRGRSPEMSFIVNGREHHMGYYLADGATVEPAGEGDWRQQVSGDDGRATAHSFRRKLPESRRATGPVVPVRCSTICPTHDQTNVFYLSFFDVLHFCPMSYILSSSLNVYHV